MRRSVRPSKLFQKKIRHLSKRFPQVSKDLLPTIEQMQNGETIGDLIPGVSSPVYKVRIPSSDQQKGKSGGFRVIYYLIMNDEVLLLTIYAKSQKENIRPKEISEILKELEL